MTASEVIQAIFAMLIVATVPSELTIQSNNHKYVKIAFIGAVSLFLLIRVSIEVIRAPDRVRRLIAVDPNSSILERVSIAMPLIWRLPITIFRLSRSALYCSRKPTGEASNDEFSIHKSSSYGGICILLLMSCVIELPLLAFVGHHLKLSSELEFFLVVTAIVFGLLILGDLKAMSLSRHRLDPEQMLLRFGARGSADIDYTCIDSIAVIENEYTISDFRDVRKNECWQNFEKQDLVFMTPMGTCNVSIKLKCATFLPSYAQLVSCIFLRVDNPSDFVSSAQKRLADSRA